MASSTSNSRNGDGGGISLTASQLSKAEEAIEILSSLTGDSDARSSNSRSSTSQNQTASTSCNIRTIVSQRASPSTRARARARLLGIL